MTLPTDQLSSREIVLCSVVPLSAEQGWWGLGVFLSFQRDWQGSGELLELAALCVPSPSGHEFLPRGTNSSSLRMPAGKSACRVTPTSVSEVKSGEIQAAEETPLSKGLPGKAPRH